MQIFKNYFKILRSSKFTIGMYMGIFMLIAILMGFFYRSNYDSQYEQTKTKITLINRDEETPLTKSLKDYLSETCEFVTLEDNEEMLKDALFFQQIGYVLIIPENFTDDFKAGKDVMLKKITPPNDASVNYTEIAVNNFIGTAKLFYGSGQNLSEAEILKLTAENLKTNVSVSLSEKNNSTDTYNFLASYLNFFVYIFIAIFILGISIVMSSYNNLNLKRRNLCAPLSIKKINLQLFFGNMVYTTISAVFLIIVGFIVTGQKLFDTHSYLFIINALLFSFCALSISFLIAQFPLKRDAVTAISNVVSLGLGFICGAFVPMEFIGENILRIAKFTPSYWYIAANNLIADSPEISSRVIHQVLKHMGIQLAFCIALFAIALAISKSGQTKEA